MAGFDQRWLRLFVIVTLVLACLVAISDAGRSRSKCKYLSVKYVHIHTYVSMYVDTHTVCLYDCVRACLHGMHFNGPKHKMSMTFSPACTMASRATRRTDSQKANTHNAIKMAARSTFFFSWFRQTTLIHSAYYIWLYWYFRLHIPARVSVLCGQRTVWLPK